MRSLARILRSTRDLWPLYGVIVALAVLNAATTLVTPFIVKKATDTIVDATRGADVGDATRTALWLAVALLVAELANTLISNIGGYFGDVTAARLRSTMSTRYFEKLLSLPQRYFDNEVTGTIISKLNRSITGVTEFLQSFANNFFPMLMTTAAVLTISAFYYWPLALLLITIFPVYMYLTALTSKKWQKLEGLKNHEIDTAGGRFAEVVGQIRVVKSFVTERRELDQFDTHYARTIATTREQSSYWHRMDALRRGILNVIFFGIYALIFIRTVRGLMTIGDMVMLIQLVTMVRMPVQMMSYLVDTAQRAIAGSVDYFGVLAEPTDREEESLALTGPGRAEQRPVDHSASGVDFEHVSFGYEDDGDVVHDVSFSIPRGQRVALVSESGGGKTTLVSLLLGLYRLRDGRLLIGGRDAQQLSLAELRRSVGVVFQDASLFSGTVRENIAYGRPEASDAEIEEAARRANAHVFIAKFADGYDTVIGERGLKLSGGQKQRIAVARAMLKDAPILVLDEATSALDTKAERAVQAGLEELMHGRTTLVIAHRLSTISSVDTIVTLRDGRVEEIGSPAQLAESGGIYAELLALQQSGTKRDRRRLQDFDITA